LSFSEFANECIRITRSAIESLGYEVPEKIDWQEPPDPSYGDLSLRVSFDLARRRNTKPSVVALEISKAATEIQKRSKSSLIQRIEAHPSGFLNFWLDEENFKALVLSEARREDYGKIDVGRGSRVLVEHTAVNPNKAIHIGHLRNVAIGDSIARILKFTGHNVFVLNYIDDSGLQVADLLVGMIHLGLSTEAPQGMKYDHYAGDEVYVKVNKEYERNPLLKEKQREVLKAIEERDPIVSKLAAKVTDRVLREQLATAWRFGAFYDLLVYESDIIETKLWESTFEELKQKGIVVLEKEGKLRGCWIVRTRANRNNDRENQDSNEEEKVLVRSDGTATYVAKDLPFAALKVGLIEDRFHYERFTVQPNKQDLWRTASLPHPQEGNEEGEPSRKPLVPWGAERSITVIDSRQSRLQRIICQILEQLSGQNLENKYYHLGYAIVSLSPKTLEALSLLSKSPLNRGFETDTAAGTKGRIITMTGRKGTFVNADDVMDALKKKALEETRKRNPEVGDDSSWLDNVSEKLAISAVRFALLKQDLDKMIVFDLEEALELIGETGPYMMYTYARASSILSKEGSKEGDSGESTLRAELLADSTEVELIRQISKFQLAVERSVKMLAPKWIAHYSFKLCEAFNTFYERNRVLQEKDPDLKYARILLVDSFRSVLRKSLSLLGIEVLEKI
jgi:arginyl-tRNA synthetase